MVVVAAVIERDGLILIGRRKRENRHPLKWEFPGGKVERGESPREALVRELQEELGIHATIGEEIKRYAYRYPNRQKFELIFYRVSVFEGEPQNVIFESIEWAPRTGLPAYDFLDGDVEFVRSLAREGL